MQYRKLDQTYLGTLNLRIGDVAEQFPDFFAGRHLLVTCLDSDWCNLARVGPFLNEHQMGGAPYFKVSEDALLVAPEHAAALFDREDIFCGFDEIYLVDRAPNDCVITGAIFTSDRCRFSEDIPAAFTRNFQSHKAVRYLSDGVGLNFACESERVLNQLLAVEEAN